MNEEWRPIKGYEGIYEVSSYWRVRSLDHYDRRGTFHKGRLVKIRKSEIFEGRYVKLCKNGKHVERNVAYIIAHAFDGSDDIQEILSRMPD